LGVAASQIETVSFGEEKPAVQGNNEAAFSKNRRAEFFYK
jgi:peptidoglycan-associated lipoprotein